MIENVIETTDGGVIQEIILFRYTMKLNEMCFARLPTSGGHI